MVVYYGDEVAVKLPSLANSNNGPIGDPYTRLLYPWLDQPGDPRIDGLLDTTVEATTRPWRTCVKNIPCCATDRFVTLRRAILNNPNTAPNTYAYARVSGSSAG